MSMLSTATRFMTGNTPGMPRHTGHTWEFGGAPNLVLHPQKSLLFVSSWTWTSSPTTIWYGNSAIWTPGGEGTRTYYLEAERPAIGSARSGAPAQRERPGRLGDNSHGEKAPNRGPE